MLELFKEIDQLQKEINKHRPLDEYLRGQIKEYYRIGLTYTSNALEGNSLTETETKIVLEEGITIGGKRLVDHLEAVGHSDAFNYLFTLIQQPIIGQDDIKKLHKIFYYRIDPKDAGVYRTLKVFLTGSQYPLPGPTALVQLMGELDEFMVHKKDHYHPVEFAALVHKQLVFIHPFIDGNGRVARLLMNLLLLQAGFTIAIIPPVTRSAYIHSLEKAHTNDRDFVQFIAQMIKETQKDYVRLFI